MKRAQSRKQRTLRQRVAQLEKDVKHLTWALGSWEKAVLIDLQEERKQKRTVVGFGKGVDCGQF